MVSVDKSFCCYIVILLLVALFHFFRMNQLLRGNKRTVWIVGHCLSGRKPVYLADLAKVEVAEHSPWIGIQVCNRHRINKSIFDDTHIGQPMFFVLTPQPKIFFHQLQTPSPSQVKLAHRRTYNFKNNAARGLSYRLRPEGSTLSANTACSALHTNGRNILFIYLMNSLNRMCKVQNSKWLVKIARFTMLISRAR